MSDDLADVLGTEENPCLEFKQSANDNSVILRAICAMSNDLPNRGGGDLLIGVDKHGNAVDSVDVSDRALLALTDMRDNGKIIDRPSMGKSGTTTSTASTTTATHRLPAL